MSALDSAPNATSNSAYPSVEEAAPAVLNHVGDQSRFRRPPPVDAVRPRPPVGSRVQRWLSAHRREIGTCAISTVFHALLLFVLWCIAIEAEQELAVDRIISVEPLSDDVAEDVLFQPVEQPEQIHADNFQTVPRESATNILEEQLAAMNSHRPELQLRRPLEDSRGAGPPIPEFDSEVGGRASAATRQALVERYGGNAASERAVVWGLEWLVRHQHEDGSWSFDHTRGAECRASCTVPGGMAHCRMGATSLALMAFLGAGHTHESGRFEPQVQAGLEYLVRNAKLTPAGADLRGDVLGNEGLYVQGLAGIVLCEAHALTRDVLDYRAGRDLFRQDPELFRQRFESSRRLRDVAQRTVDFIVAAQHVRGGWRYQPNQPGDTSVTGWQVMALESARTARLHVPGGAFTRAGRFLDSVQIDRGARYGYLDEGREGGATTAVGLLCRMYLGWKRDRPALRDGVAALAGRGPSSDNMYHNYYATQVLHHWGGEEWTRWNRVMRDQLIDRQETTGHARGSWPPADPHADAGGRLYETALATMTLEVYYRHLPLYRTDYLDREPGEEPPANGR